MLRKLKMREFRTYFKGLINGIEILTLMEQLDTLINKTLLVNAAIAIKEAEGVKASTEEVEGTVTIIIDTEVVQVVNFVNDY